MACSIVRRMIRICRSRKRSRKNPSFDPSSSPSPSPTPSPWHHSRYYCQTEEEDEEEVEIALMELGQPDAGIERESDLLITPTNASRDDLTLTLALAVAQQQQQRLDELGLPSLDIGGLPAMAVANGETGADRNPVGLELPVDDQGSFGATSTITANARVDAYGTFLGLELPGDDRTSAVSEVPAMAMAMADYGTPVGLVHQASAGDITAMAMTMMSSEISIDGSLGIGLGLPGYNWAPAGEVAAMAIMATTANDETGINGNSVVGLGLLSGDDEIGGDGNSVGEDMEMDLINAGEGIGTDGGSVELGLSSYGIVSNENSVGFGLSGDDEMGMNGTASFVRLGLSSNGMSIDGTSVVRLGLSGNEIGSDGASMAIDSADDQENGSHSWFCSSRCENEGKSNEGEGKEEVLEELPAMFQLFVKTCLHPSSISLQATSRDSLELICERVYARLGLPAGAAEQWLVYNGRPLGLERSLGECGVGKDATLHLVARMQSTSSPQLWRLAVETVMVCKELARAHAPTKKPDRGTLFLREKRLEEVVVDFLGKVSEQITSSSSLPSFEHAEIFRQVGAAEALATLYSLSLPSDGDDEEDDDTLPSSACCAGRCLRILFTGEDEGKTILPRHTLAFTLPLLLDLCTLIGKAERRDCSEYRSFLASLLDEHWDDCFRQAQGASKIVLGITPLVLQISCNIHKELQKNPHHFSESFTSDCKSFLSFLAPLCEAQQQQQQSKASHHLEAIFENHIQNLNTHFAPFNADNKKYPPLVENGCLPLLNILKALHMIARLSSNGMESFRSLFSSQSRLINLLIEHSQLQDTDHTWLIEFKAYLQYNARKELALSMLPISKIDNSYGDARHSMHVRRSALLQDSFESLAYVEPEKLQGGISAEFAMEEAKGPGVLREWFGVTCKEIFNPANALFKSCPKDPRRVFPNPASGVNPGHLTYFRFCGRVIALALMYKVQIDAIFDLTLFRQLSGLNVSWTDVKDADPDLYEGWGKLLEIDSEYIDTDALGLTFVSEVEQLGTYKTVELCPGGEELKVNSRNRSQYVDLMVKNAFVTPVIEQIKALSEGFSDLLWRGSCYDFFQLLQPEEFDSMIYGKDRDIPVEDWKAHTEYHEYKATDKQIEWFWKIVTEMSGEERRKLLHFSTSISHLPVDGFAALPSRFHIYKSSSKSNYFPTAHTCFYQLVLPQYPTRKTMHERLHAVIEDHLSVGFGFI